MVPAWQKTHTRVHRLIASIGPKWGSSSSIGPGALALGRQGGLALGQWALALGRQGGLALGQWALALGRQGGLALGQWALALDDMP